ncbi:MAG: RluA family pseudouridine synthase [Bacillota bacterium]|nr:RluA family pseudouridine synthase [Bacillota bacterium]
MERKQIEFIVPESFNNKDLKTFLKSYCKVSARMITRLVREENGITCNGKLIRTIDNVRSGDIIFLNLPKDENAIEPVYYPLDIVFEDDTLLVLNKPPHMPVHPTKIHQRDTLANAVVYHMKQNNELYKIRVINRLDRDTTGLVVIAKDRYSANFISKKIEKTYFALCEGVLKGSGTIDAPIRVKTGHTIQREVHENGERSITHYKVLKTNEDLTLLEIKLETGRTHQIRTHFSSIGHPLAGDDMYGGHLDKIKRQALHCGEISFIHPKNREIIILKAEIPDDMQLLPLRIVK